MNGRKRHILVDTQGLLLKVKVHEAGLSDKVAAHGSLTSGNLTNGIITLYLPVYLSETK